MQDQELNFEGVEQRPLRMFTEKAYLDYSMYVILDRALPALGDGLKPVQRRIIYAMSELGLSAAAKHKKSARTVGDVIGKFHPHGDSACYEAMVHMAQAFSYRYPIVDGQGNWGSTDDPKSFAAMRYTESRLTRYADVLLDELGRRHGRLGPELRRHAGGAAVAAGAPAEPAAQRRLRHRRRHGHRHSAAQPARGRRRLHRTCSTSRKPTTRALMKHVKGPDLPTGAEIIVAARRAAGVLRQGQRQLSARAPPGSRTRTGTIVITQLPYQVSGSRVQEQIAQQMRDKKLPMVEDIRDESDHENPTRLVIEPRSNRVDVEQLMAHLFATTDLERSYRVNLNVIALDGRPRVMGLKALLHGMARVPPPHGAPAPRATAWSKVARRLHILDGLLIAYLNLDEVIRIIRREDEPKPVLMKRFKLTDEQAEAILETKLRHLAKLEEMKIRDEQKRLADEREELEALLASKAKLTKLMRSEIEADAEEYGDERRTQHRRARGGAGDRGDRAGRQRAGDHRAVHRRLGARGQGPRDRSAHAGLQDRRRVPGGGARPQHAAGGVHRQHRPRLQPAGAHPAVGARRRASRCPGGSIRPTARASPAC